MKKSWIANILFFVASVATVHVASAAEQSTSVLRGLNSRQLVVGELVSISANCVVVKGKAGEFKIWDIDEEKSTPHVTRTKLVTYNSKEGEVTINIARDTELGTKSSPKKLSDFKAGDSIGVLYKEEGAKKLAIRIAASKKKP